MIKNSLLLLYKKYIQGGIKKSMPLILFVLIITVYKCPIKAIFGVDCPGCGMTRAFRALVVLDIKAAFQYHQLFAIPIICVIYQLFYKQLQIKKRYEIIFAISFIVMFIARWSILLYL